MTKTERKLRVVSMILIAVLVFTAVFNVAFVGGISTATSGANTNGASSSQNTANNFVKSNMDFNSIREQYLNYANIELNTASFDGDRWVIVELEGDTLYDKFGVSTRYNDFATYSASEEGRRAQANLRAEQTNFLKKLDRHGIDYTVRYSYTAITNAVAIKVNAEAYNAINKMSGVVGVYYSESYAVPQVAVTNNANVYTTGIYDSSDLDYKGEGMVVAILDTGLDHTHEAFQTMPSDPSWDREYVESVVSKGKLDAQGSVDDFYYSDKVPFAYDYADDDANVYPSYSSHGTHVAGIVAGQSEYVVNEATGEKFIGVAPEAQLVICKVFTDNLDSEALGGANTLDILAALNDCTQLGVDVINMSLGSSAGFADEKSDAYLNGIYEAIKAAGISLVVAASNDYSSGFGGGNGTNLASNPDSGTVGSPSTYASALSVASINGQKSKYISTWDDQNVAFITTSSDQFGVEYNFIEQLYDIASKSRGRTVAAGEDLKFKYVVISGVGRSTNYTPAVKNQLNHANAVKEGYDGTIAFVKRGDTTFAEKVQAAMNAGADACVIYNNVAGTIRMSLGEIENPIPACSISMDSAVGFVENVDRNNCGTVKVNTSMEAGPFMSDFSSWGPMPNLELKPEITAHGGEITSAVAGGYDKYSGTSMASPNMAGAVAILRQYLQEEYKLEGVELNARVNQVLMSTATIANNENGNPYSPRKQGAGLAGIADAIKAEGYITTLDGNDHGEVRDKTKLELFDDPEKKGVYELNFTIHNVKNTKQTYKPTVYVMTETMSSDLKTVAEKAYMLTEDCKIEYFVGNDMNSLAAHNGDVEVAGGKDLAVRVKITLGDKARKYLDDNFVNGMYVEGFVSMVATGETQVTLGLPYLAFYGDWTDAPLFDYDTYELAESEQDTSVPAENKLKASAAETRVLGMYHNDQYIFPLGQYIYNQNEEDVTIYPEREKIALSIYDTTSARTIYELYAVYAGLLRGAAYMDVLITDAVTGEVIFTERQENISKSFAAGGSNRGASIRLELKPEEWGLNNNQTYNVSLKGELDYNKYKGEDGIEHGATAGGDRNTFDFQFTVDYEEPQMMGYRIRYVPYTENRVTKYKIWMDVDVYDNQFVQAVLPCYLEEGADGTNTLRLLTEYPIPVYGQRGETSTVSFEVTDFYDEFVKTGNMFLQVEDYAMNAMNYRILPGQDAFGDSVKEYPESVEFSTDAKLVLDSETPSKDALGNSYYNYTLNVEPFTLYKLNTIINPTSALIQNLSWSGATARVKAQADEIYAGQSGEANLMLVDEFGRVYAAVHVVIAGAPVAEIPSVDSIKLGAVLNGEGNITSLDGSMPVLELNPEQKGVKLTFTVTPWYCDAPQVTWTSSNESIVKVDEYGNISPIRRGRATVTVTAVDNERVTKSVTIVVGDEFDVRNYTLYNYYGSGVVEIPNDRNIMYLDEDCFKYNTAITKVILPTTLTEIPINAFMGCTSLEEVVIPGQCTTIREAAFAGCTKLEKVTLGTFVDSNHNVLGDKYAGTLSVARYAFFGCTALTTIENSKRLTTINGGAFQGCTALKEIDLSGLRVVGNTKVTLNDGTRRSVGVFEGCTSLQKVVTSESTIIGEYMFMGCTSLKSFAFKGSSVAEGAFANCTNLATVTFENPVSSIGVWAFANTAIKEVTLPDGKTELAASAFESCTKLTTVKLSANTELVMNNRTPFIGCDAFNSFALVGTNKFYTVKDGVVYGDAGKKLVAVPYAKTDVDLTGVTEIGDSAFAGVTLTTLDISGVSKVGQYAFSNSSIKEIKLPSNMTSIPRGLFSGCENLVTVTADDNFAKVKNIEAYAFQNCTALRDIEMANVTEVGNYAFAFSSVRILPSSKIESVGVSAFEGTKLQRANLPSLTSIGSRAFAAIQTLRTVSVGAVTAMGDSVFIGSGVTSATFADGTTMIGDAAFFSEQANDTALTVTLPNSVKYIGQGAFANRTRLTEINLSGVEAVDLLAFFNTRISNVDLSNVVEIGYRAFAGTSIKEANLKNAVAIGAEAFYSVSALTSLTLEKVEIIGDSAFMGTSLAKVVIPASMNSLTYDYEWNIKDEKDRVESTKYWQASTLGVGAFADINGLKEFEVAEGNEVFKVIDGVLYAVVENGLVLVQYPTARDGESYVVEDGTVSIADGAFNGVNGLKKVEFPYTVKSIGSYAFFLSTVTDYTFNSVDAPVLVSTYDSYIYEFQSSTGQAMQLTYFNSNFVFYWLFFSDDEETMKEMGGQLGLDLILTAHIPVNGRGYDSELWKTYFMNVETSEEVMPEDATYEAIAAIDAIKDIVDDIPTMTVEEVKTKGALIAKARAAYNLVTSPEQQAFIADRLSELLDAEKALRDRKVELKIPAYVVSLVRTQRQNKVEYIEGESFDPTGMKLLAIYDDGSEVEIDVAQCVITPDKLTYETMDVVVTYTENGKSASVTIGILVKRDPNNQGGTTTTPEEKPVDGGLDKTTTIIIAVVVPVAVLLVAGVAVLIIFKKKKSDKQTDVQNGESENSNAQSDEIQNVDAQESVQENFVSEASVAEETTADAQEDGAENSALSNESAEANTESTAQPTVEDKDSDIQD